jgi:hypothetical protein
MHKYYSMDKYPGNFQLMSAIFGQHPQRWNEERVERYIHFWRTKCLDERRAKTLDLRFALNGNKQHTLKEAGLVLGISAPRVRQLEATALRKLRAPAYSGVLRNWLYIDVPEYTYKEKYVPRFIAPKPPKYKPLSKQHILWSRLLTAEQRMIFYLPTTKEVKELIAHYEMERPY